MHLTHRAAAASTLSHFYQLIWKGVNKNSIQGLRENGSDFGSLASRRKSGTQSSSHSHTLPAKTLEPPASNVKSREAYRTEYIPATYESSPEREEAEDEDEDWVSRPRDTRQALPRKNKNSMPPARGNAIERPEEEVSPTLKLYTPAAPDKQIIHSFTHSLAHSLIALSLSLFLTRWYPVQYSAVLRSPQSAV